MCLERTRHSSFAARFSFAGRRGAAGAGRGTGVLGVAGGAAPGSATFAVFAMTLATTVCGLAGARTRSLTLRAARGGVDLATRGAGGRRFGGFFATTVAASVPFALTLALPLTVIRPGGGDCGAHQHLSLIHI